MRRFDGKKRVRIGIHHLRFDELKKEPKKKKRKNWSISIYFHKKYLKWFFQISWDFFQKDFMKNHCSGLYQIKLLIKFLLKFD